MSLVALPVLLPLYVDGEADISGFSKWTGKNLERGSVYLWVPVRFTHLFAGELLRLFVVGGNHISLIFGLGGVHFVSDTAAASCYLSSVQVDS